MSLSICMTTYNGSNYIRFQLDSIIPQLEFDDEIIVCDDRSTDNTVCIIESYRDERIKICVNTSRLGHVKNFEKAILQSKNDIIVLSDQDDVWHESKLDTIRRVFLENDNVDLYHHGITTIDSEGAVITKLFNPVPCGYNNRSKINKIIRAIIKNHYFGCCMSFRKKLKNVILPFPREVYAHDHWISLVSVTFGKSYCDDLPLINYRQHNNNVTPKSKLSTLTRIKLRLKMIKLFLILIGRIKYV